MSESNDLQCRLEWAKAEKEKRDGRTYSWSDIARACDSSPAAVTRWRTAVNGISYQAAQKLAAFLGVSADWLAYGQGKRQMASDDALGGVPLIQWESANDYLNAKSTKRLPCPVPHSPSTFALQVVGVSMDGPGGYKEGEVIFVDPAKAINPADMLNRDVVISDGANFKFRRLRKEPDGLYMQALNPDWNPRIQPLPTGSAVVGVVIFSGMER